MLNNAKTTDIYYSVFVFIVAKVEDFFSDVTALILTMDSRRIKTNVSGIDLVKKFDVEEILNSVDKNEIISKIIRQNLISLFYAGPAKQKEYFERILGIKLEDELWNDWFEFKATRDIIVHNSGIINNLYVEKSGQRSRGNIGDKIVVDSQYFSDSLATMKRIIGKCDVSARKSLKPND